MGVPVSPNFLSERGKTWISRSQIDGVIACTERPETETWLRSAVGPHRSRI